MKMQESSPEAMQQSPSPTGHEPHSSPPSTSQVQTIMSSPPPPQGIAQHGKEIGPATTTSPRNGQPTIVTPLGPGSGNSGSGIGVGPGSGEHRHSLHRNSSPESVAESQVYAVSVRYRSAMGSFEEHVACGFANLYTSGELADVTVACEGKLSKAHKLVLAISSPYFRHIFKELHDLPCQHPIVILHGIRLKDWENVMRLIYYGIVHINSNEIDDFISTAECLKIDGLCEDHSSSQEDMTPPYEFYNRFPGSGFASPEESGSVHGEMGGGRSYTIYSPEHYENTSSPSPRGPEAEPEQGRLRRPQSTNMRHTSSSQCSPGIGGRESLLKIETQEAYGQCGDSYENQARRPPSCPEGFKVYSHSLSVPVSPPDSRIQAVRHPVISRRRNPSSDSPEEVFEVQAHGSAEGITSFNTPRTSRLPQSYQPSWESCSANPTTGETLGIDKERQFSSVISGQRSPTVPLMTTTAGLVPLSVISRQQQPPAAIPFQLLSPGFLQRMPQLHMLNQNTRATHAERSLQTGGVITTVHSPHSSPQSQEQQQQSTLAMLREKIAAGQPIYSRGLRPERSPSSIYCSPRFPSAALGSSSQLSPHEHFARSPSRSNLFVPSVISSHQQQPISRPKTKAIRSSQVPQSARYTAAEVDAMVDKVQNFPGNMVPCAICSKFVKRERLRAHIHECHLLHGKRIVCPHCGIGLKSKGSYRVHIWRHKRGALPTTRQRQQDHHQLHHS